MTKKTPQPRTPRQTVAQLVKKVVELENTLNTIKDNMTVFERHYRRRGDLLLQIAKLLSEELQMHRLKQVLEAEMAPRRTEKIS